MVPEADNGPACGCPDSCAGLADEAFHNLWMGCAPGNQIRPAPVRAAGVPGFLH